jgi:hypothetical protein
MLLKVLLNGLQYHNFNSRCRVESLKPKEYIGDAYSPENEVAKAERMKMQLKQLWMVDNKTG